ncbi:hypothetical protein ACJX0J_015691, partial [Zea mays]
YDLYQFLYYKIYILINSPLDILLLALNGERSTILKLSDLCYPTLQNEYSALSDGLSEDGGGWT